MAGGNTTQNTSPVIKAQVFSDIILEQLQDGFLPDGLHRDVTDFSNGETLYIPTIGETVIHDWEEDTPAKYDPVDTGQVTLTINQYKQGGTYITDKLKQDAYALAAVEAQIPQQHLYKIREAYETDMLSTANNGQTSGATNAINNVDHRWVAGATNQVLSMEDFVYMRLAFQKADVPEEGWLAIVDPITEAALNELVSQVALTRKPLMEELAQSGFSRDHRFIANIMGFDVYTSNRLPTGISETINGGPQDKSTASTNGVANLFMSVANDMTMPLMGAWRQMPSTEGERNKDFARDEYVTSARWGFGVQRKDTLGVVISSATNFK